MDKNNELETLIENLPLFIQDKLKVHLSKNQLLEIVLDLGRRPEGRFLKGPEYLSQKTVSWQDIDYITKRLSKFSNENRAGIERTLHRISCIRNRQFLIIGLTCRVGRSIFGTISGIRDLLESGKSILILGQPGVGKTTIIREISRVLADELEKRVIVIDTSNEIAGDSDIPHLGIGRARRMQVPKTIFQHQVMLEAVENHMPQVIIIDEIGTDLEVLAARTIAEKGVQLVGTTHGNCLENVIKNPALVDLLGGIQYVTLSDDEAKRRGTNKTTIERKTYPSFEIVLEINSPSSWTIHEEAIKSVDLLLLNSFLINQKRNLTISDKLRIKYIFGSSFSTLVLQKKIRQETFIQQRQHSWGLLNKMKNQQSSKSSTLLLVIYPYSISNNLLKESLIKLGIDFVLTNNVMKANLIIGLKKHLKKNLRLQTFAKTKKIPMYSLNQLSLYQLTKLIKAFFN